MAVNQIPVDVNTEWGRQLRRYRNLLNEVYNLGDEVRGKAVQCQDGIDYSQFEEQFGIPVGQGAAAFAELDTVWQTLTSGGEVSNIVGKVTQFIDQIG